MTQFPAHLQNRQGRRQVAERVSEGLGTASPPYVSIKGGAFTLIDSNGEKEPIETNYLDCVIIDTAPPSRVFWGVDERGQLLPFDPNADSYQAPACFSDNGIGASKQARDPQSTVCRSCKWDGWGSAVSKVTGKPTKACGIIKKVAVLAYVGGQSDSGTYVGELAAEFPFLLRVPVMSHENLRIYSDKFKNQPFDVSEVVTRIKFVHGAVGQIEFDAVGFIDPESDALVEKVLGSKVTDMLVGRGDQPIAALPAPQEQPRPLPAAHTAAVSSVLPGVTAAPTAPGAAGNASSAPPARRGRKPKAKPQAAPGPFAGQQTPAAAPFASQQSAVAQAPLPADGSLPSFLRREQPTGGIVQNAPPPNEEMAKQLDSLFNLKT